MPDNTLIKTHMNEVFKIIVENDLDPSNFTWKKIRSKFNSENLVSLLTYKDTEFYFQFDFSTGLHWCQFSPGSGRRVESSFPGSWRQEKNNFAAWLLYLRREIEEPDLWSDISKYQLAVGAEIEANISNEPFTSYQVDQIIESLNQAKAFLTEHNLIDKEHNQFVEDKLNYLAEAARRQGRKDWLHTCIGAIITIAVALALNPEQTNTIWNIIKGAVAGFLKLLH